MRAKPGDWLVVERADTDHQQRTGQITEVRSTDGSPPYLVHWVDTGHTALVFPGPDARVLTEAELDELNERRARRFATVQAELAEQKRVHRVGT